MCLKPVCSSKTEGSVVLEVSVQLEEAENY